jgi:FKBP-type peptidyl-prolyl cis-trans isomerase/Bacterial Ig-like domain (group 3)
MIKRRQPRAAHASKTSQAPQIESLEGRRLLSGAHAIESAGATAPTSIVMKTSRQVIRLGQLLAVTVRVAGQKGGAVPTGNVELFSGSSVIGSDNGPLELSLNSAGVASYKFDAGGLSLFSGIYKLKSEYLGDTTHAASTSAIRLIYMIVPPFRSIGKSGLKFATVDKGHGKAVVTGNTVQVAYTGMLASDGTIFDYATGHGAGSTPYLQFQVEANPEQVITGFDEAVFGMKAGETRTIFIPSALGYGAFGSSPNIPANADLVFLVTLLSIVS